ncbi:MAG: DUF2070 family protein [Candidatus Methanospirare jalkutatii]|nr:DUF2070 family protein [Candidatus Methanospirare jalkutatii]
MPSAENAEENALKLTKFIFKAPDWKRSVLLSLLLSAPLGFLLPRFPASTPTATPTTSTLHSGFLNVFASFSASALLSILSGVLLFGVPALLSAFLTVPLCSLCGAKTNLNRSALLSFLCLLSAGAFVAVSVLFSKCISPLLLTLRSAHASAPASVHALFPSLPPSSSTALIGFALGMGFVLGFRLLILLATASNSVIRVALPASIQTILGASACLLLFGIRGLGVGSGGETVVGISPLHFLITSVCFFVCFFLFARSVDASVERALGVSGFELIRTYLAHLKEGSKEMEEVLSRAGKCVEVPVTVFAFRKKRKESVGNVEGSSANDAGESSDFKAVLVAPSVHSGLTGSIGGGDLPRVLENSLRTHVFLLHGMANHDYDLAGDESVARIKEAVSSALKEAEFSDIASTAISTSEGEVKMLGQRFGRDAFLLTYTLSPRPFEDADFSLGMAARSVAVAAGARHVAIADAHNSGGKEAENLTIGSSASFNLLNCVEKMVFLLKNARSGEVKAGVACVSCKENVGEFGIRALITEVCGERTAYILVDGNNMLAGLRERILERIRSSFGITNAEILTTDSHALNTATAFKFVGACDASAVESAVLDAVASAISDIEPVEVGVATKFANVVVFGEHFTAKLLSVVNTIVEMSRLSAIFAFISALLLSLIAFTLI